jgi:uroporphyrinogen-III decarboxylase
MMDFKERVLTTLNHEEPDRVPVAGFILSQVTSNQILGKQPADFAAMLETAELRSGLKDIMNSTWPEIINSTLADWFEAAIKLGFDANWTIYSQMEVVEEPKFKQGLAMHDIWGRAWELRVDENGNTDANFVHGLCATENEWYSWVERHKPLYDEFINNVREHHKLMAEKFNDRILTMGSPGTGVFDNTWQPMGFENFCRFVYQKPEFIKEVIEFETDLLLRHMNAIMESGVDVVVGGDDLGQKTGPLMRPEQMEKLFGESYRRISEAVHSRKKKLLWHTDGNVYALLDKFVEWGFDGVVSLEPTAGMELGKVREQMGHKLILVGNLDIAYLLVRGTKEEVEDAVRVAIKDAAEGGGFILSPCNSHSAVDPMRLEWMVDTAHKYGKYPIIL